MSYILDALRRADAERVRERAEVPGVHTQVIDVDDEPGRDRSPLFWIWVGLGALGLFLLVVMVTVNEREPVSVAPAPVVSAPAIVAPVPAPTVAVEPMPAMQPVLPQVVAPEPPKVKPRSNPVPVPVPVPADKAESARKVHHINELPENIRQGLPKLTLGGAMYSDKAASRMLIINGKVFHEGDALAPELSLKQIRLKEAVLEFKGFLYIVTY